MTRKANLPPAISVPINDANGRARTPVRKRLLEAIENDLREGEHAFYLPDLCTRTGCTPLQIRKAISNMRGEGKSGLSIKPVTPGYSWVIKRWTETPLGRAAARRREQLMDEAMNTSAGNINYYRDVHTVANSVALRLVGSMSDGTRLAEDAEGRLYRLVEVGK